MSVVAEVSPTLVELVLPRVEQPELWRLSVEQYHDMVRHGILTEEHNVELLDGILVAKMPRSTAHSVAIMLVQNALARVVPDGWSVDSQDAVTLPTSEPEPDCMVIRGQARDYLDHHPSPREVALIVEMSESSLRYDQGYRKIIYAAAAIPIYWIINLVDRRVEVYTDPTGPDDRPDYRQRQELYQDEEVPLDVAGREVARISVRELLP